MTSPISLLTALGAPEPAAAAPAPEDPGLFNAVLTAALQAGMLAPPPPATQTAAVVPSSPVPEEAPADTADDGATAEESGGARTSGDTPMTRAAVESGAAAVALPAEDEAAAAAGEAPAESEPHAGHGGLEPGVPEPDAPRPRPVPTAPGSARKGDAARPTPPTLSAAARTARIAARALALLDPERPSPRVAGEIARGARTTLATDVPATATPAPGSVTVGSTPAATPGVLDGAVTPGVVEEASAVIAEGLPVGAPPAGEAGRAIARTTVKAAPGTDGSTPSAVRERPARSRVVAPAEPDGSMSLAAPADAAPTVPVPAPAERAAPSPVPLAAAWSGARRAARPDAVELVDRVRRAAADAVRPAQGETEPERDTPLLPADDRVTTDPSQGAMAQAARLPMAPVAPAPRAPVQDSPVMEDEAEALIARARRNLEAPAAAVAAPRWGAPRPRPAQHAEPQAASTGDVRRAVPTVPAVEALMEALARTLEGAEVTAVRVTMGRQRPVGDVSVGVPKDGEAEEVPAGPVATGPEAPAEGTTGARATPRRPPVERMAPTEPREGPVPAVGASVDDDRAPAAVDRLVVEREAARPGRAELTGFEPTGRALREAVAARPAMRPAPDLPSDRQELPIAARDESPRAARREPEERSDPPAPSDAGARGSAGAAEGRARESRPMDGADRAALREAHELREAWVERGRPAGAADRVTLQVADSDGRQTRIRVSVLGDQVRATILPPDSSSARQLEQRMDELQAALVRQGFTDAKVSVQAGRGEGALPWGASQAAATNEPRSSSGTDQPPGDQRQGTGRRDGERQGDGQRHPHQRPRERDPNDRRRQ